MNFPLGVILALVVIAAFHGIAVWGIVVVFRWRMAGIGVIVAIMALLIAWVVFLWPVYWD